MKAMIKNFVLVGCLLATGAVHSSEKKALVVAGQATQKTSATVLAQCSRNQCTRKDKEKLAKFFFELICFMAASEGIKSSL